MTTPAFECDGDTVIAMEDLNVGVEEMLQYAAAVLPQRNIRELVRGLEALLARGSGGPDESGSAAPAALDAVDEARRAILAELT